MIYLNGSYDMNKLKEWVYGKQMFMEMLEYDLREVRFMYCNIKLVYNVYY